MTSTFFITDNETIRMKNVAADVRTQRSLADEYQHDTNLMEMLEIRRWLDDFDMTRLDDRAFVEFYDASRRGCSEYGPSSALGPATCS